MRMACVTAPGQPGYAQVARRDNYMKCACWQDTVLQPRRHCAVGGRLAGGRDRKLSYLSSTAATTGYRVSLGPSRLIGRVDGLQAGHGRGMCVRGRHLTARTLHCTKTSSCRHWI